MGDMSVTCNYSQRRKRKKRRKERYNGVLFFFFSMYVCRGGGKKCVCVCVLSGIEDNNTKKIFSPNLFLVCVKICFSTCLLKTKTQIAFLF